MSFKVFVPHATANKELAFAVASHLQLVGIYPQLCETNVQPGVRLDAKIRQDIIDADAIVAICTPESQRSIFTQHEIGGGVILNKLVIPVVFPGFNTNDMGMLSGREWLDVDPKQPLVAIRKLQGFLRKRKEDKEQRQNLGWLLVGTVVAIAIVKS